MLTASEIADLFGQADHLTVDEVRSLTRRIRHFETAGLIQAAAEKRDARGTSQFDAAETSKARLLATLADYGIGGRLLERASEVMTPRASGVFAGRNGSQPYWCGPDETPTERHAIPPLSHHSHLPSRIRAGEAIELVMRMTRQFGHCSLMGGFRAAGETRDDDAERTMAAVFAVQKIEIVGEIRLDAAALLRPVLAALPEGNT